MEQLDVLTFGHPAEIVLSRITAKNSFSSVYVLEATFSTFTEYFKLNTVYMYFICVTLLLFCCDLCVLFRK